MVHDRTKNGVVSLLKGKPVTVWWLDVRSATQILDAISRNRVKPLKVHDVLTKADSLLTVERHRLIVWWSCCGGIRTGNDREENL